MLKLVSAQESCHEDEVKEEEWPVDFNVSALEAATESRHQGSRHHLCPEVHLVHFSLETLILIVLSRR